MREILQDIIDKFTYRYKKKIGYSVFFDNLIAHILISNSQETKFSCYHHWGKTLFIIIPADEELEFQQWLRLVCA